MLKAFYLFFVVVVVLSNHCHYRNNVFRSLFCFKLSFPHCYVRVRLRVRVRVRVSVRGRFETFLFVGVMKKLLLC